MADTPQKNVTWPPSFAFPSAAFTHSPENTKHAGFLELCLITRLITHLTVCSDINNEQIDLLRGFISNIGFRPGLVAFKVS